MLTRRDMLAGAGAGAAVAAAVLPVPSCAATIAPAPMPAWAVGVEDLGHTIQFAPTLHEAVIGHIDERGMDVCDACADGRAEDCESAANEDFWCEYGLVSGKREPTLDRYHDASDKIDNAVLRSIGWCVPCVRCEAARGYMGTDEYPSAWDTSVIDGEGVVCHECIEDERRFAERQASK